MTVAPDRLSAAPDTRAGARRLLAELGLGFLFWLAFDLMLEPGNLVRAAHGGLHLSWPEEAVRLLGAGLLGAPTCPLLFWLARRFPVAGAGWARHAALQAAAVAVLAPAMILAAQPFAERLSATSIRGGVGEQLASNLLLLAAALALLAAGANLVERRRSGGGPPDRRAPLTRIPVASRGGTLLVDADRIDWIEFQGNYLALHVGAKVHLVRRTLAGLKAELDPHAFARIHRRTVVNLGRVQAIEPLGNGDALARLATGEALRVSRAYRATLQARLRGGGRTPSA